MARLKAEGRIECDDVGDGGESGVEPDPPLGLAGELIACTRRGISPD
jgi:hypothetical protein